MTFNDPSGRTLSPRAEILLLSVSHEVAAAVRETVGASAHFRVEALPDPRPALDRVRGRPSDVAALVIGPASEAPVELAQRIYGADRELSVILVANATEKEEMERSLLLTPFLGEDVLCVEGSDPEAVAAEVHRAAQRRRQRQSLAEATSAMAHQVGEGVAPLRIEGHFGRLMEQMPIGVVTVDEEGGVHGWNRRARELLASSGYGDRVIGRPLALLFSSPEREAAERYILDTIGGTDAQPPRTFDRSLAAGRTQFLQLSAIPVEVTERRHGAMVLVQDVTAREEARRERDQKEEALRQQRRWFEATLTSIGDGVIATDSRGRVTFMNRVAEVLTGWPLEEATGLSSTEVFRIVDAVSRETSPSPVEKVLQEGKVTGLATRTLLLARDGRELPIDDSGAPIRDTAGELVGTVMVFRDITERRESERALRASEEQFRLVVESLTDYAIFTIDLEGRVRTWNSGARKILGWEEEEILGAPVEVVFTEEDRRDGIPSQEIRDAVEKGRASDDRWHVRSDGSRFWASGVMFPLRGDNEKSAVGFVKILRDQTEAKRSREQLEARARQQEAVARFGQTALASTELQTLLDEAARTVARTLELELCKVLRLLPDGTALRMEAGEGWAAGTVGQRLEDAGRGSQAGYTLQVAQPVVLRDLREEDRFGPPPLLEEHGAVSGITVIIGSATDPWGVLGAHTATRRDFSPDDIHFLQAMANILAAAIQRRATEDELHRLNETLEERVEERTAEANRRATQLQRMATELAQAEQRERRRLADTLHDHLQQYLAAGWMRLSNLQGKVEDPELAGSLEKVLDLVSDSIDISRNLTVELSPPVVQRGSLLKAFQWLADWVEEQYGLPVEVEALEEVDPESEETRNLVFQCVRELLFNATKHSEADRATIRMAQPEPGYLRVTVSDRGRGFDPAALPEEPGGPGGFGLLSIRERLDVLGGAMDLESAPGEGTTITLTVPLEKPARDATAG